MNASTGAGPAGGGSRPPVRACSPRRRRGHTLVELLVTIAIIILIAAVVLTALWKLYRVVKRLTEGPMTSIGWVAPTACQSEDRLMIRSRCGCGG